MNTLANKIIISTRPLTKRDSFKEYLIERGAMVLDFPMIEICSVELNEKIKEAFLNIISYNWIVFTSKNGVEYFYKVLNSLDINTEKLTSIKIAVIGKKTSEEVLKNNIKPFFVSSGNTSEDLLKELSGIIKTTDKVLLPLGILAADTLVNGLSAMAAVTRINVYDTIAPKTISEDIIGRIKSDNYNIIIFTSPSGFQNFNIIMNENNIYSDFRMACIGKTTEKEMLLANCKPLFTSIKSDGETFAKELESYFTNYKN